MPQITLFQGSHKKILPIFLVASLTILFLFHESLYIENALDIENLTINVNSLQSVSGAGFMTCSIFVEHIW